MSRIRRISRGFTLIELVLVILIIGFVMAIVAPTMGQMLRSNRLDNAARTVAAVLKDARARAAADAKPYRLVIDTDDNTCWIEVLTPEGFIRPKSSAGRIRELGDQLVIELTGGTQEDTLLMVRVEPDGTGELAQIAILRKDGERGLAVYCRTPTEPYIIGDPISPAELEQGGDDVEIDS